MHPHSNSQFLKSETPTEWIQYSRLRVRLPSHPYEQWISVLKPGWKAQESCLHHLHVLKRSHNKNTFSNWRAGFINILLQESQLLFCSRQNIIEEKHQTNDICRKHRPKVIIGKPIPDKRRWLLQIWWPCSLLIILLLAFKVSRYLHSSVKQTLDNNPERKTVRPNTRSKN